MSIAYLNFPLPAGRFDGRMEPRQRRTGARFRGDSTRRRSGCRHHDQDRGLAVPRRPDRTPGLGPRPRCAADRRCTARAGRRRGRNRRRARRAGRAGRGMIVEPHSHTVRLRAGRARELVDMLDAAITHCDRLAAPGAVGADDRRATCTASPPAPTAAAVICGCAGVCWAMRRSPPRKGTPRSTTTRSAPPRQARGERGR